MKLKNGFVLKTIGENNIVVPVGAQSVDFRCMITLNGTGAFLWKLLETEQTDEDLIAALLAEYAVDSENARRDVDAFVGKLRENHLLEE